MQYPNLFKRLVPFALALGMGLLLASFFVNVIPNFRGKYSSQGYGKHCREEVERLKMERDTLKFELERERFEHDKQMKNKWDDAEFKTLPYVEEIPAVPVPPLPEYAKPKHKRPHSDGTGDAR